MRWGIDLDGCAYNFTSTANYLLSSRFGYDLGEWVAYDYAKLHVAPEHWDWLWGEGLRLGLFRHGHLIKGTKDALDELATMGEVVIITHRPAVVEEVTREWLKFHLIPYSELHVVPNRGPKSAVQPQCDLYVDDNFEVCKELWSNTSARVLLFDQPWNRNEVQDFGPKSNFHRVPGWPGVIKHARKVEKQCTSSV